MKIRRPTDAGHSGGLRPPAYDQAVLAAIEKKKSEYILLVCGHYTTWEDDERVSHWRPKKKNSGVQFFCESCGKWLPRLSKRKPAVVASEPLF